MYLFIKKYAKRYVAILMAFVMIFSSLEIIVAAEGQENVPENTVITISSAEELAMIGADENYPMTGDYVLGADIDLSGVEWMPLGGYVGPKGTMDAEEPNVFSGTFDGMGHVISGMSINLNGYIDGEGVYAQVGLFSVIAGSSADDYARVQNLIFADVNIKADFYNGLSSVGALAGDVNGYSQIDCVSVLSGNIEVNLSRRSDTVGAGGIIGECRTSDSEVGNHNVSITNCYNGATVTVDSCTDYEYAGGIIGRISKTKCKNISNCINVAHVRFRGESAYGICPAEYSNLSLLSTMSNCYFIDDYGLRAMGSGANAMSKNDMMSGTLPTGLPSEMWTARKNCYVVPTICHESSVADLVYLSTISLDFADGESENDFKTFVALPSAIDEIGLTWTSSNERAVAIKDDKAEARPGYISEDEIVTLTVATPSGVITTYKVKVISTVTHKVSFDCAYAEVGKPIGIVIENASDGERFSYEWKVGDNIIDNSSSSYTPTEADLENFITVNVTSDITGITWKRSTYLSSLPVVYVDTDDGNPIDSEDYRNAHLKLQGNSEYDDPEYFYDGATEIKGRGNSTWWESEGLKRPYKLKLDKKTDLLGIGGAKNKHWVLLANMIDHTNMRNELVSDLAKELGVDAMSTTNVVLILNGEFIGNYELCEHIRIGKGRVDIFDWEELAEDIAKEICMGTELDPDHFADEMKRDFSWLNGEFVYDDHIYYLEDYIDIEEIPEFTGGFLVDWDFRWGIGDWLSSFITSNEIPMYVDKPEEARTNPKMMNYIIDYVNAYEAALRSKNHTTTYNGETVHYADLFDLNSLLGYWFVCEYTNNWDSMKNSTFFYKDLTGKAKMGPVWDYDWAFANITMYGMPPLEIEKWHTTLTGISSDEGGYAELEFQKNQWNRFLVTDPYFVTKAYEMYKRIRPTYLEDVIKEGGKIDSLEKKYQSSSDANDAKWAFSYEDYDGVAFIDGELQDTISQLFNPAVESMKTFITKRVEWFDKQFIDVKTLYKSLGNDISSEISVEQVINTDNVTIATATVTDEAITNVEFIINGKSLGIMPVSSGKATVTIEDKYLEEDKDALNTLQVLALDSEEKYFDNTTYFTNFTKDISPPVPTLTPTPEDAPDTAKPQPDKDDSNNIDKGTARPFVKVVGKSSVKRKKIFALKVKRFGISKKIKVSLDKKGKKLLKIKKVTKKKIVLKARNKKGVARIVIKCGKYKVIKKVKIK